MVGFDQSAGTTMLIAMSSFRLSGCNERCFKITFINLFMSAYTIFLTLFTFAVCLGVTFLMWCGVVLLISHFSKWKKLVVAYPANLDQTLAVKKNSECPDWLWELQRNNNFRIYPTVITHENIFFV
jgi:hypothetical protein